MAVRRAEGERGLGRLVGRVEGAEGCIIGECISVEGAAVNDSATGEEMGLVGPEEEGEVTTGRGGGAEVEGREGGGEKAGGGGGGEG